MSQRERDRAGRISRIAELERAFGITIKNGHTVEDMARRGKEFVSDKPKELRRLDEDTDLKELHALLKPYPADLMAVSAANMLVNSPKNEGADVT